MTRYVAELLTCVRMLHLCVTCRARVVELRTERFWTRECTRLVPERTGVQRLSIRTRYGDMAPDCCTEYSLGKLYLTLLLPPSSPERRGQFDVTPSVTEVCP